MTIKWGIISTANIAQKAVIPGIKESETGEVYAIASRNLGNAKETAEELEISVAYGSYEELLADPNIDAVYIPLPNHLHKEWSIKAMEAGKHVLCEKPIALNTKEALEMEAASKKSRSCSGRSLYVSLSPQISKDSRDHSIRRNRSNTRHTWSIHF